MVTSWSGKFMLFCNLCEMSKYWCCRSTYQGYILEEMRKSNLCCWNFVQEQPLWGFLKKRCSENMQQIDRRTPIQTCAFNKVVKQLSWNHTSIWMFSCKFAACFQNTFSSEGLLLWNFVIIILPSALENHYDYSYY